MHLDRTQEWLALEVGVNPTLLSRMLRGRRHAPASECDRIEQALSRHERTEHPGAPVRWCAAGRRRSRWRSADVSPIAVWRVRRGGRPWVVTEDG